MAIYKVLFEKLYMMLTLLMIGLSFRGCSQIGGTKNAPLPKICLTYPIIVTFGTVILYPKIQKVYKSCETPLEFC